MLHWPQVRLHTRRHTHKGPLELTTPSAAGRRTELTAVLLRTQEILFKTRGSLAHSCCKYTSLVWKGPKEEQIYWAVAAHHGSLWSFPFCWLLEVNSFLMGACSVLGNQLMRRCLRPTRVFPVFIWYSNHRTWSVKECVFGCVRATISNSSNP